MCFSNSKSLTMSLKLQLTRLLKLLQCFIISVAGTCLQFTGLKTCN